MKSQKPYAYELGQIKPPETLNSRDAFHVPAVVMMATETLRPGDLVKFGENIPEREELDDDWDWEDRDDADDEEEEKTPQKLTGAYRVASEPHAVVDPFLPYNVKKGQHFWALVMPDYVGKVTHHFETTFTPVKDIAQDRTYSVEDDDGVLNDSCRGCY